MQYDRVLEDGEDMYLLCFVSGNADLVSCKIVTPIVWISSFVVTINVTIHIVN